MPHSQENTYKSLAAILIILTVVTVVAGGVFFLTYAHIGAEGDPPATSAAVTPPEPEEPEEPVDRAADD